MMRKYIMLLMTCCCMTLSAQQIKMMSYNIRNAKGMDNQVDYDRLAQVIKAANPDVAAIQELDSATTRSKGAYVLEEIGKRAGYHYSYAPAINYQGGKYGIGILYKVKPLKVHHISLPGREEQRALLVAEFKDYTVCVAHLSLTEEDRMASLELIKKEARKIDDRKPLLFAGDLNAEPDSPFIKGLQNDFDILSDIKQPTFPADKPDITIDYICQLKNTQARKIRVKHYGVIEEGMASDHRPIMAILKMKKNKK